MNEQLACAEYVWDGPYRMKCSYMIVNGRCVRHGEGGATYAVKERCGGRGMNISDEAVEAAAILDDAEIETWVDGDDLVVLVNWEEE